MGIKIAQIMEQWRAAAELGSDGETALAQWIVSLPGGVLQAAVLKFMYQRAAQNGFVSTTGTFGERLYGDLKEKVARYREQAYGLSEKQALYIAKDLIGFAQARQEVR